MRLRITSLLSASALSASLFAQAVDAPISNSIPVWQQQISVAVDEYMLAWSQQAMISDQTDIEYQITDVDPRLNLPSCEQTPTVDNNRDLRSGKLTLRVSCVGGQPWSIYVPVSVKRIHPVVHVVASLPRQSHITESDLELKKANIDELNYGYFLEIEDAVDMIAKRTIVAGEPLSPSQVTPPVLVSRGDSVLIEASNPAISVKMPGLAMTDGRKGQQIPVKNVQSQRLIRAKVIAHGHVKVPL